MDCKLSINLTTGQLEVEGSEALVKEIYKDFKEMISNGNTPAIYTPPATNPAGAVSNTREKRSSSGGAPKTKVSNDLKVLTDLNLRPKGKTSLKDFAAKYVIKSGEELSLLVVYYLKEELKETVTQNHIYSCFKELGKKVPQHFKQTHTNNKNSKNWINVDDWNDIKFTVPGMNHMEHDITKSTKDGK